MGFYQKMAEDRKSGKLGATPKYRVLQADMLKPVDREKAATITAFIQSDTDAYKLAGHDGFAYKDLDIRRRVGVVTYRGVEVALLFKREVIEQEPGPADPIPEKVIKDPAGAWMQIDLLDTSPVERRKGIGDRLSSALAQVSRLQILWQEEKAKRERLEEDLAKLQKDKETVKALRERVALLETEKKMSNDSLEHYQLEIKKQKDARQEDKKNLVKQMFPVFNTVWLAGVHRVSDTLYGMVKQQLTEALEKIGVKLVEPKVGDTFDPNLHHAVHGMAFPEGAREIGTIVQIHRVGWQLGSLVVDPADVSVGIEQKGTS